MLNSFRPKSNCEEEAKFLQDRILSVEKNFAQLSHVFGLYSRKVASLRDRGDEVAKTILTFSNGESINKSLSAGLDDFADSISSLNDFGDVRAHALNVRVVEELSKYEEICKRVKEEVKDIFAAREREVQRKRQLDRIRDRNPRGRQEIMQAETELVKATAELSKTIHTIEDRSSSFERQKLHDLKSILLDFIAIEMGYHARALEILTKSFKCINDINEESDLQDFQKTQGKMDVEFKKSLRLPASMHHHRHSPSRRNSLFRSTQSLGSLGTVLSTPKKRIPGILHSKGKLNKSEETLDSMKCSVESESVSDSQEEDDTNESDQNVVKNISPVKTERHSKKSHSEDDDNSPVVVRHSARKML
ncbi:hypothetical protein ABEB36_002445 [Hypothenemus hampei]|uniref:Uncharacterized protein n=1 Tax=Hypothenemus hampei TaxID=57062 RepID=A0ABD1F5S5_HYPHA